MNEKVQSLFDFIDFLDANKNEYITTYLPLVAEVSELNINRNQLIPEKNYKEKLQYDILQKEIKEKFALVYENVTEPILGKLQKLGIWAGDEVYTSIYNGNTGAILDLTKNFTDEDVKKIKTYERKYISFRSETNSNFLSLGFVFDKVDEVLKILFDYFADSDENNFVSFQPQKIEVADTADAAKVLSKNKNTNSTILVFNYSNSRVSIWEYVEKKLKDSYEYRSMNSQGGLPIDFGDKKCYVKSIGLAAILASTSIPGENLDSKNKVFVNGHVYFAAFKEGYESGQDFFIREYRDNRFQSKDTIVSDLHLKFYHGSQKDKPWKDWATSTPLILSNAIIKGWGYYQGILYELERLIDQQPTLFKDFHNCPDIENHDQTWDIPDEEAPISTEFKHNGIFKGNAFEVWESMWESFKIGESSRTDVRFMVDIMKRDSLIHKGTTQKRILEWIDETYEITIGKLPFKDFKSDTMRNAIYTSAKSHFKG